MLPQGLGPVDRISNFGMGIIFEELIRKFAESSNETAGEHFTAVIVSDSFAGKRLIQRHQLVYAALGDRMREEIHALSMKTLTPEEFQK